MPSLWVIKITEDKIKKKNNYKLKIEKIRR